MSSLKEDLETLDPAEEVQKAFDQATATNWTIARHSAAMSMGAAILNGVFGPEIKGLQTKGTYPNALRDVVIVLWLCSLDPDAVTRINSRLNIDQAITDAYAWAEAEGIRYGTAKYLDGVRTLTEIVGGIYASFYAVEGNNKPEPTLKKSTGRPGKSASVSTRRKPAEKALAMS